MARRKRETESYLESVRELYPFIPSLAKYRKRKRLKPQERSRIAFIERVIRESRTVVDDLRAVPTRKLKDYEGLLYEPETMIKTGKRKGQMRRHHFFQAYSMRNVGSDFRMEPISKDLFLATDHGRQWIYWKLKDVKPHAFAKAGKDAFNLDIDALFELARQAFDRPDTKGVYLWSNKGRVGFPMPSLRQFQRWIVDRYEEYTRLEEWVNGLAVLVADVGETISRDEWLSFQLSRAELEERRRERRQLRWKRYKT